MSLNLADFIKDNLIEGYSNGSFTKEQANIFAANYLTKAIITQADFTLITNVTAEKSRKELSFEKEIGKETADIKE